MSHAEMNAISSEHRLRIENLPFDFDVYYPLIRDFTYRTVFQPLQKQEAAAILAYHRTRYRLAGPRLTAQDVAVLRQLEAKLDALIAKEFPPSPGSSGPPVAFLRLCGRSPKDGEPLDRAAVLSAYEREHKALLQTEPDTPMTKLRAIGRIPSWLCVRSGKEAMSLLLTSERVFADLNDWLQYGLPEQLCLREYDPDMRVENEFRAFVYDNRMTAISQYDHYCVYPEMEKRRDRIRELILEEWGRVHGRIGSPSYVIDFVYLPSRDAVRVIELSPFLPCTGPALFSWTNDRDLLMGLPTSSSSTASAPSPPSPSSSSDTEWEVVSPREATTAATSAPPSPSSADQKGPVLRLKAPLPEGPEHDRQEEQLSSLVEANWELRWATPVEPYDVLLRSIETQEDERRRQERRRIAAVAAALVAVHVATTATTSPSTSSSLLSALPAFLLKSGLFSLLAFLSYRALTPAPSDQSSESSWREKKRVFLHGTLRRGRFWHGKFLGHGGARFVGQATTVEPMALVLGPKTGVPYLAPSSLLASPSDSQAGEQKEEERKACLPRVRGEVWEVDEETLRGLDALTGAEPFQRLLLDVRMEGAGAGAAAEAVDAYVLKHLPEELRGEGEKEGRFLEEYTEETQRRFYRPIAHMQRKQRHLLGA